MFRNSFKGLEPKVVRNITLAVGTFSAGAACAVVCSFGSTSLNPEQLHVFLSQ